MSYLPYIFAAIVVLVLLCIFCYEFSVPFTSVSWSCPTCSAKEHMITANNIAAMSRGYNVMNTGGSYEDAMKQLHEAEIMTLSSVNPQLRVL